MSLIVGGVNFLMADAVFEPVIRGNAINLSLAFATEAEARDVFGKLAEGGKVKCPLEPAFWGALYGQLEDKYGIIWMITTEGPGA